MPFPYTTLIRSADPARGRHRDILERTLDLVLALETLRHDVELPHADRTQDQVVVPQRTEQLGGALFAERSEEHTSELQSLMRTSYAVFCLTTKHSQSRFYHTHTSLLSKLM